MLARLDIGALYRVFGAETGISQRQIAARTGQSQSEVSEYDSGVDGMGYCTRALGLADEARDGFGIANAAGHAGATLMRTGHPDEALQCFQLGQPVLAGFQPGKAKPAVLRSDDPRVPVLAGPVSTLQSVAVRRDWLVPLAATLET